MKIKFDSGLDYQLEAIKSVTDLFEGLTQQDSGFQTDLGRPDMFNELGIGNTMTLSPQQLLANLYTVQKRNNVAPSRSLIESETYAFPNFSIEMETGTGKTYVYLRTIFELNSLYGFRKFIIVVPSVAIREGVTSSIKSMRDHFKGLYDNVAFDYFVYQSKDLSLVRQFAVNNQVQIMVINIQAFQKDAGEDVDYTVLNDEQKKKLNVIHQEHDKMSGRRPIEYVQATNPILIIDEPQSVDNTDKSQKAIRNLNPLFCLRYSATHVNPYNLVYQLDPIRAYNLRLVKQIEVVDASGTQDHNQTLVRLDAVGYWPKSSKTPQAKVTIFDNTPNGSVERQLRIKLGTNLARQTKRPDYEGYTVSCISAMPGNEYVEFQNGVLVEVFQESGGINDDRIKSQIQQTIEAHFVKERELKDKGIKVISLFFIDRVKSYRGYDDNGNPQKGKIAQWFEEFYTKVNQKYENLIPYTAEMVHEGYFSSDRKKGKVELLDTSGDTARDNETYKLIMQDKERLLSIDEPLRFIFSHSALREGWDNPNVFQICTLREMGTDRQRRQTIGRGLRLPVNQDGNRVYDDNINRLTVIANESFEDFAKGLQSDIEAAVGRKLDLPCDFVKDARKRQPVSYNKRVELNPDFKALWDKISQKTRYCVEFKTENLIERAADKIKVMQEIKPVRIEITRRDMEIKDSGIKGGTSTLNTTYIVSSELPLPDILAFLQRETDLTRNTLTAILKQSGRLGNFTVNPQLFMIEASRLIKGALNELIIGGIKYEPLKGQFYEMRLFESEEVTEYLDRLYKVQSTDDRTPYDFIACESKPEKDIAEHLDNDCNVKFFCKLPRWFKVSTPLGNYNPDWAVVVQDTQKLYLVRETKSTLDRDKRRESENKKVDCGKAHFHALGVNFKDATTPHEVLQA